MNFSVETPTIANLILDLLSMMCQCVEDSSFEKFSGGGGYGDGLFDYCVSPDPSFSQGSFL